MPCIWPVRPPPCGFSDTGPDESGAGPVNGSVLVISQFTLHADTRRGNRPGFELAAPAETARQLYECYVAELRKILGANRVVTGQFQADMSVTIINDGPVTIELRSRNET